MPRGSLPGERRGGRQRGTPNKATALRDAAIFQAVVDPNFLPLDVFLALMRDTNLPLEERITAAEAALPFVHSKPKARSADRPVPRRYGAAVGRVNVTTASDPGTTAPVAADAGKAEDPGGRDPSPLDFLLGLMRDAQTPHHLRVRVAHILAPYLHPKLGRSRDEIVIDDPYGFDIDPKVARELRDANRRLHILSITLNMRAEGDNREQNRVEVRVAEIKKGLKCPAGYTGLEAREDRKRLRDLERKRESERPYKLSKEEDAEEAHVTARLAAYLQSDEGRARSRISDLRLRSIGRVTRSPTPDEQREMDEVNSEIERLKKLYPDLPPDPDADNDWLAQSNRRALEAIRKAKKREEERVALARAEEDLRRAKSPRGS